MNRDAWAVPASLDTIAAAMSTVAALVEPDASPERTAVLTRFVAGRGYTDAEIRLIEREGPVANHYGKYVRMDVLDGIVQESRRLRAMLEMNLTGEQVAEVCTAHPELSPDDFAPGTFDSRNNRLYRYAPEVARSDYALRLRGQGPEIEDDAPRRIDAPATGALAEMTAGIGRPAPLRAVQVDPPKPPRRARDLPTAPVVDDPTTGRAAGQDYHAD